MCLDLDLATKLIPLGTNCKQFVRNTDHLLKTSDGFAKGRTEKMYYELSFNTRTMTAQKQSRSSIQIFRKIYLNLTIMVVPLTKIPISLLKKAKLTIKNVLKNNNIAKKKYRKKNKIRYIINLVLSNSSWFNS